MLDVVYSIQEYLTVATYVNKCNLYDDFLKFCNDEKGKGTALMSHNIKTTCLTLCMLSFSHKTTFDLSEYELWLFCCFSSGTVGSCGLCGGALEAHLSVILADHSICIYATKIHIYILQ